MAGNNSHLVLRMPLDLDIPVDAEVYSILYNFKSVVACKNYIMSAVLYYARSPLVLSANALVEALGQANIQGHVDEIMGKLEEVLGHLKGGVKVVSEVGQEDISVQPPSPSYDSSDSLVGLPIETSHLKALKQQFKI
jgi:hypothetical protein